MLLYLMIAASSPFLASVDAANEAYTRCLFAAVGRLAPDASVQSGHALLQQSCEAERTRMRDLFIAAQIGQGYSREAAQRNWSRTEAISREAVVRSYLAN